MKIGIDARLLHETGVGRYIRNLIDGLAYIDSENEFIIFLRNRDIPGFRLPNARWQIRSAEVRWHSIAEQFVMPWLYVREHLDLLHVPYFNVPVFYPGAYVVTIHDLTILDFNTGKASTLPYFVYMLKRIGYRLILEMAVRRSAHILTVSKTVRSAIVKRFRIPSEKITVTYEGIDDSLIGESGKRTALPDISGDYFLYVGNVYPHKNINVLLEAMLRLRTNHHAEVTLVFVGPDDYFYRQLELLVASLELEKSVRILHSVSDRDLSSLYTHAVALVFPSKTEGFGLPALEALASGCRVIVSDIPVFREILVTHAFFTDTSDAEHLSRTMNEVRSASFDRTTFRKTLVPFLSAFSWKDLAQRTRTVYINTKK